MESPSYSSQHLEAYRAVLAHELRRLHGANPDALTRAVQASMAGGVCGKSSLLNRIAAGRRPLVAPPPTSYSYPCYEAIEGAGPWELTLDGQSIAEVVTASRMMFLEGERRREVVMIDQEVWDLVERIDQTSATITFADWGRLGFAWKLSLDVVAARESGRRIVSWHDSAIDKITTLDELRAEQRWHVSKKVEAMRAASSAKATEAYLRAAREKDRAAGAPDVGSSSIEHGCSRFEEISAAQTVAAMRRAIDDRLAKGQSALPSDGEIDSMVHEAVQGYLQPRQAGRMGWYSIGQDGQSLMLHAWHLRRVAPAELADSVYLDLPAFSGT